MRTKKPTILMMRVIFRWVQDGRCYEVELANTEGFA